MLVRDSATWRELWWWGSAPTWITGIVVTLGTKVVTR